MGLGPAELARMIDHTLLRPQATAEHIRREAREQDAAERHQDRRDL